MLRTTFAGLRAHARRLVATAFAIIAGVGFVVGTFIFGDTARAGFFDTFARVAKNIDVVVEPPITGPTKADGLSEAQLSAVRTLSLVDKADGRIVASLPMLDNLGRAITNFGRVGYAVSTDADPSLRAFDVQGATASAAGEADLDAETAAHQRLAIGDTIAVLDAAGTRHTYRIVGLIDFGASKQFSGSTVVGLPAATIRRLTGRSDYDEIVATARLGVSQEALAMAVRQAVGPAAVVTTGDQRRIDLANSATQMATQFATVLLIFGVVSLVVAAFVIYNTFAILLAQRVRETALLRCVGATRRQIFASVLVESFIVGFLGSLAGGVVGIGVAAGLRALLNQAFNSGVPAHAIVIQPASIVIGLIIGVIVTVSAAFLPAVRATRTSPLSALRDLATGRTSGRRGRVLRLGAAAVVAVAGIGLTWAGSASKDQQSAALLVVAGGVVTFGAVLICAPLFIGPLTEAVGWVPRRLFGPPVRLAVANAKRNPGRTAITSATLMIGVGLMSLFAVVIASVSETASRQLTGHYPVDYVMSAATTDDGAPSGVPPAYAESVRERPEFAGVAEVRVVGATMGRERSRLAAIDPRSLGSLITPDMTEGSIADLRLGTVVVSATWEQTRDLPIGSTVTVRVGSISAQLTVVGKAQTSIPGTEQADALVSWDQLAALAGPGEDTVVFAKAAPGITPIRSRDALDAFAGQYPLVRVDSIADLSNEITNAVNGLIAFFAGLMATATLIALFGIANTLSLSVLERTRESATVRALGLTRTQLRVTLLVEALLMGMVGALVGITYGLSYGRLLVRTLFSSIGPVVVVPWLWLAGLVGLAALAAVAAAVLPARRAARASIVAAMSDT